MSGALRVEMRHLMLWNCAGKRPAADGQARTRLHAALSAENVDEPAEGEKPDPADQCAFRTDTVVLLGTMTAECAHAGLMCRVHARGAGVGRGRRRTRGAEGRRDVQTHRLRGWRTGAPGSRNARLGRRKTETS